MIVRRISYFTFIVAITTIATVSACNRTNTNINCTLANEKDIEIYLTNLVSNSLEWQTQELPQGIKSGKFKITTNTNDNSISFCLQVNKSYKGEVNTLLFNTTASSNVSSVEAYNTTQIETLFPEFISDKRRVIAHKNLILLI